jgi:hypothetical protein
MSMFNGSCSFGWTEDLITGKRSDFSYRCSASHDFLYRSLCREMERIGRRYL